MFLTYESVHKTPKCDHSNGTWATEQFFPAMLFIML